MSQSRRIRSCLVLTGTMALVSSVLWAAEGIIYKNPDATGTYCHLTFPAIREDTVSSGDRPVLNDRVRAISSTSMVLATTIHGQEQVLRQRADARRQRDRFDGEND